MSIETRPAFTPIEDADFRALFRRHPAGVVVVTLADPVHQRPVGFTATSLVSVSLDPPIAAFSISRTSSAWPSLSGVDHAVLNFLGTEALEISTRFATSGIDRFAETDWSVLTSGEPVLDVANSWARVQILDRHPAGDSHLVVAALGEARVDGGREPLVFHDRTYYRLGESSRIRDVPAHAVRH